MKYLYHATDSANKENILKEGIKPNTFERAVFLADNEESAVAFLRIRLVSDITVFKIRYTNNQYRKLVESFDHSQTFFHCRAFMDRQTIEPSRFENVTDYNF